MSSREDINKILWDGLGQYIPTQELTHAGNVIYNSQETEDTEEKILEMTGYLMEMDKEFIPNQTVNTKSITNNQVRLVMQQIRNKIKADNELQEDDGK